MGGGSSKQRSYVLKIDSAFEGGTSASNPSSSSPPPTNPPVAFVPQNSKTNLPAAVPSTPPPVGRQNSAGQGMLARQNSATILKQSSGVGPGMLSKQNSRQSSLRNMSSPAPSPSPSKSSRGSMNNSTVAVAGGRRVSSRVSWLMKEGGFGSNVDVNSFEYGRVIGRGLMGSVRIAKHKQSGLYVAVKSIKKDYIQRHRDQRHISSEREILSSLSKSPFCIRLFGTFQDTISVHFVMELAVGGELFRRLQKKQAFPPPVAKFYASEIFCALRHVHKLGYVYRDLKPENIMLDEEGHCKLVDFGFSIKPDAQGLLHTQCGTPAYLSPEQLNGKFTNGYTSIVDWWSFGILLYELLTGKTPFSKSNKESSYEIYLRILENHISFPFGFDSVTKELVTQLCHADLSKRLILPDVIADSTYWEIPWDAVNNKWLVPPHVPRINIIASTSESQGSDAPPVALDIGGDVSQFDTYFDGDKPMETGDKSSLGGEFNGF